MDDLTMASEETLDGGALSLQNWTATGYYTEVRSESSSGPMAYASLQQTSGSLYLCL